MAILTGNQSMGKLDKIFLAREASPFRVDAVTFQAADLTTPLDWNGSVVGLDVAAANVRVDAFGFLDDTPSTVQVSIVSDPPNGATGGATVRVGYHRPKATLCRSRAAGTGWGGRVWGRVRLGRQPGQRQAVLLQGRPLQPIQHRHGSGRRQLPPTYSRILAGFDAAGLGSGLDAAVNWDNRKAFFFSGRNTPRIDSEWPPPSP